MTTFIRYRVYIACLSVCFPFLGCVGVIPMHTRTETPNHAEINQKVSAKFIVPGQTSRSEVLAKLKPADSGVEGDRFFLARWSTSNKAAFYAICAYISCVAVGANRVWKSANALVEFDDQDLVTRYTVFRDGSLAVHLSALATRVKTVDFNEPREIDVQHVENVAGEEAATLVLGRSTFEVRESGQRAHNFQISSAAVKQIRHRSLSRGDMVEIDFNEKTKVGKRMIVRISVPDLFLLLEFFNQRG